MRGREEKKGTEIFGCIATAFTNRNARLPEWQRRKTQLMEMKTSRQSKDDQGVSRGCGKYHACSTGERSNLGGWEGGQRGGAAGWGSRVGQQVGDGGGAGGGVMADHMGDETRSAEGAEVNRPPPLPAG